MLLRPWTITDVPAIVTACQDPAISRWSPAIPYPYTKRDAVDWLERQEPTRLAGMGLNLAVVRPTTNELLGAIGLETVKIGHGAASIGYWLAPEARGHGYITNAVRLLAQWGFDHLRLARIELITDPQNVASQRVAERCGFRQEGYLRSHMLIRHSGQRRDSIIFSLLPGELKIRG